MRASREDRDRRYAAEGSSACDSAARRAIITPLKTPLLSTRIYAWAPRMSARPARQFRTYHLFGNDSMRTAELVMFAANGGVLGEFETTV